MIFDMKKTAGKTGITGQDGSHLADLLLSKGYEVWGVVRRSSVDTTQRMLGLGNLDAYRDWGYAGDYVEAMWLMLQQDQPDDYVICTGKTYSIREFLDLAFSEAGITASWKEYVYIDPKFYRPSEVEFLRGNCAKARDKLGWSAKHDLRGLVKLMLDN